MKIFLTNIFSYGLIIIIYNQMHDAGYTIYAMQEVGFEIFKKNDDGLSGRGLDYFCRLFFLWIDYLQFLSLCSLEQMDIRSHEDNLLLESML